MVLAPKYRVEVLHDSSLPDTAAAQHAVPQLAERHAALSLARLDAAAAGACPPADAQPPGGGPCPLLAHWQRLAAFLLWSGDCEVTWKHHVTVVEIRVPCMQALGRTTRSWREWQKIGG